MANFKKTNMFHSARIKLTAWYLAIIMAISLGFSVVIYHGLIREVDRFSRSQRIFIERRMRGNMVLPPDVIVVDEDLVAETKQRIITFLASINAAILILSGGLGYILAGRTLAPIADMLKEQNRFISDASHELKTPLTSLKSAFEVHLRNKKRTLKESDTVISESILEVNNLQRLSESLLSLAHYQHLNGNSLMKKVSVNEILKSAVKQIQPIAQTKHIRIHTKLTKTEVRANRDNLIQLFVILLDNAVKYSNPNTTVNITGFQSDHTVSILVKDRGIGIAKKNIPHIFDRFYQEDTARSQVRGGGYGLGLAIAKKIIQEHNGSISVESKPGKGSVFMATLPLFSYTQPTQVCIPSLSREKS